MGAVRGEPGRRSPLLGTLKDIHRKALETGIYLYRGHIGEPGGEVPLPGTSRDGKRGIWKRSVCLSMWAVWGKLGGRRPLLGILKDSCSLS